MKTHELKTWPTYFQAMERGEKSFELRKNDRDFHVGDRLYLREYDPITQKYSGHHRYVKVIYMIENFPGIENGYVIMGIEK